MRTVNRAEAANAANVPYTTLKTGRYHGERKPAVPAPRAGARAGERWSVAQVLAVRLAKVLEQRGVSIPAMAELVNVFWSADEADLRRLFAAGRRYVMVVGRVPVAKMLFTREEIEANDAIDYKAARDAGLPLPQGIDVAAEYDRITAALLLEELK